MKGRNINLPLRSTRLKRRPKEDLARKFILDLNLTKQRMDASLRSFQSILRNYGWKIRSFGGMHEPFSTTDLHQISIYFYVKFVDPMLMPVNLYILSSNEISTVNACKVILNLQRSSVVLP